MPKMAVAVTVLAAEAAGNVLNANFLEVRPDGVAGLGIHVLHAAQRQVVFLEEGIVGKDSQDVGQCVPDAENRFHCSVLLFNFLR